MVKNTLARGGADGLVRTTCSTSGLRSNVRAFGYDDPVALAKALMDFAKTNQKLAHR